MAIRVGTAVKNAILSILVTIIIVLVVSYALASATTRMTFEETLGMCLTFGGAVIMYAGAMSSAGSAELGAMHAAKMTGGHKSNFYEQYAKERQARRDSQFYFMFLMVIAGCILLGMGFWILG